MRIKAIQGIKDSEKIRLKFMLDNMNENKVFLNANLNIKKRKEKEEFLRNICDEPNTHLVFKNKKILENFLLNISKLKQDWTPDSFIDQTISFLKSELKSDKVILGLSGGVDSPLICYFAKNNLDEKTAEKFFKVQGQKKLKDLLLDNPSLIDLLDNTIREMLM